MGDPKFLRRTYDTPKHPWEAGRMAEERKLLERYGLKNKRELWKAQSILRGFRGQARDLQARLRAGEPQAQRETTQLLGRLTRLGVLPAGSTTIDDVLALTTEDVLRRRLRVDRVPQEPRSDRQRSAAVDRPRPLRHRRPPGDTPGVPRPLRGRDPDRALPHQPARRRGPRDALGPSGAARCPVGARPRAGPAGEGGA